MKKKKFHHRQIFNIMSALCALVLRTDDTWGKPRFFSVTEFLCKLGFSYIFLKARAFSSVALLPYCGKRVLLPNGSHRRSF